MILANMQRVTAIQKICLYDEVNISIKLLQLGLGELQRINGENDFYYLPFLLLSNGFERLMKCMICFKSLEDKGHFPTLKEIKGKTNGHDLLFLKNKVISDCISNNTIAKQPANKEDYNYISTDNDLNELIKLLSDFGKQGRYYNFDIVTRKPKPALDVKRMWEQYEVEQIKNNNTLSAHLQNNKINEVYEGINMKIVSKLERFVRVLVRQFTLGNLGKEAKTCTGIIGPFLFLRDNQIGQIDYRNRRK